MKAAEYKLKDLNYLYDEEIKKEVGLKILKKKIEIVFHFTATVSI